MVCTLMDLIPFGLPCSSRLRLFSFTSYGAIQGAVLDCYFLFFSSSCNAMSLFFSLLLLPLYNLATILALLTLSTSLRFS